MESVVSAAQDEIEHYSNPEANLCKFRDPCCDAMMLGLIFRAFRKIKIYPEASTITKSVQEVNLSLRGIKFPELLHLNKSTACCASPLQSLASQGSGPFLLNPQYSTPQHGSTCANCHKLYKAPQPGKANHAEHCLPLTRLKKNLDDTLSKVTGLEYSQFVRKGSEEQQVDAGEQAVADLWSTVEYCKVPKV